jgi:hypothetical protein
MSEPREEGGFRSIAISEPMPFIKAFGQEQEANHSIQFFNLAGGEGEGEGERGRVSSSDHERGTSVEFGTHPKEFCAGRVNR